MSGTKPLQAVSPTDGQTIHGRLRPAVRQVIPERVAVELRVQSALEMYARLLIWPTTLEDVQNKPHNRRSKQVSKAHL